MHDSKWKSRAYDLSLCRLDEGIQPFDGLQLWTLYEEWAHLQVIAWKWSYGSFTSVTEAVEATY